MRVRIATTALVAALAAGCSGGHGAGSVPAWAAQGGMFRARVVTVSRIRSRRHLPQPKQRIWVNTATGAFRVALVIAQPEYRLVSLSDGHTATQVWGSDAHPHITA